MGTFCFLCGDEITPENDSKEHIIPNAIGGRKKVSGFICRECNNRTGQTWDKSLADDLTFFTTTLGVKRERKTKLSVPVIGKTDGRRYILDSDCNVHLVDTEYSEKITPSGKNIHFSVGNEKLARTKIKELKKKYPTLNFDEKDLIYETIEQYYHIEITLGGINSGRSMLKSILAVLFNSGMDYHVSPNILEYFKGKETTTPWHFHLGPDPVIDLQDNDFNYHVICIEGNKETGSIIAYLRYFGILQCSVLLSESYNKSSFQHSYAINVHKGEAITAQFDMNLKNFNSNPDVCGLLIYLALKEALGLFVIDKTTIENTLCSVLAKHQLTKSQLTLKNFDPIFNTALCNLLVHTPSFALTNTGVDFLTSKHNSLKIKHKLMRQLTKNFEEIFPSPQEQTQSIKPAS